MDELTLGLLGVGAVAVLIVIAYNAWQNAKARRQTLQAAQLQAAAQRQSHSAASAPLAEEELPFIGTARPVETAQAITLPAAQRQEPSFSGSAALSLGAARSATARTATLTKINERIDCVVPVRLVQPITGDTVLPLVERWRRAGSKPILIEGRVQATQTWSALHAGETYDALQLAVQMANRTGALNELEFSEFITGVHRLSDAVEGSSECPDMLSTVKIARELDRFAAQCDTQLSINLRARRAVPWSAHKIQTALTQDGLLLMRDGTRFAWLDAEQQLVFTVQFNQTNFLRDDLTSNNGTMLTLLLDVPVIEAHGAPFQMMRDYALTLAKRIDAALVDDQGQDLTASAFQLIEQQLIVLYAKLKDANIAAGLPLTQRLFS